MRPPATLRTKNWNSCFSWDFRKRWIVTIIAPATTRATVIMDTTILARRLMSFALLQHGHSHSMPAVACSFQPVIRATHAYRFSLS